MVKSVTPDDESDLEALKTVYWYLIDLHIWQELMEYLYRTAQSQEDFKELLMLHRLNQRMHTQNREWQRKR